MCDIPMRVDETIALAALIQATIAKLYKLYTANQGFRLYRRALIMENKWRASRYGLEGKLIDFGKQTEVPARDLILEYLDFVDDVVDELDSREEIQLHSRDPGKRHRRGPAVARVPRDRRSEKSRGLHH